MTKVGAFLDFPIKDEDIPYLIDISDGNIDSKNAYLLLTQLFLSPNFFLKTEKNSSLDIYELRRLMKSVL